MLTNRNLLWVVITLLGLLFIRNEMRLSNVEDQIDNLNTLIHTQDAVKYTKSDLDCLTKNIYYEAGIENEMGKYAVANVTLNRVKSGKWGDSICKVVYAKSQFSWTLKKHLPKPDSQLWKESQLVAMQTLHGTRVKSLTRSLYYHADYIKQPRWVDDNHYATKIGQHIFYNKAKNSSVSI